MVERDALHAGILTVIISEMLAAFLYVFYQRPLLRALGYPPWETFEPELTLFGFILMTHALLFMLPVMATLDRKKLSHRLVASLLLALGVFLNTTPFLSGAAVMYLVHAVPVVSGLVSLVLLWLPKTS